MEVRNGKPYSRITGYIAEGLFKSQEEIDNSPAQNLGSTPKVGDIKYRDLNGDGIIDSDDQTMISKYGSTPRYNTDLAELSTTKSLILVSSSVALLCVLS